MDVTVECKEGDEAAPPVESFEDMMLVRRAKRRRVARDDDDDDLADLARRWGSLFSPTRRIARFFFFRRVPT
jgi:hypothetical protein